MMSGFASYVAPGTHAQLALIGPSTAEVSDDSEGAAVLSECAAAWQDLPESVRSQVWLLHAAYGRHRRERRQWLTRCRGRRQ